MNLRQLEVFHAIMRTGSVTGAARLLNVTQPSVSTVLKHCEAQLRFPLFNRVGGRLQPTPEAQALLPDIETVFSRLAAVERLSQDLAGGRLGTLSLAAAFPIANGYLAQALATFLAERPGTRAALQSLNSPQVVDRVASREVELGIVHEPVVSGEVETELLVRSSIACVMRSDHPLARHEAVPVAALADQPVITYLPQILFRSYVDGALSQAGIAPPIVAQVSVSLTGIMLARHGGSVALVEPLMLRTLPFPDLVARPLDPPVTFRTVLVRPRGRPDSTLLRRFVAHLRRTLAEGIGIPPGGH
ncbi:LysR family transcriptional regulator [Pararoseomonas indoligenes]|uniref:LysR family transcriptional regulator n=1 Tax=Roseomonas indoligenes TaxID=2820811 RepID=A0A940N0B8_9PROT|nr:LysR family transcriptional regulator [Pararoseomonas indoligenes]MBP0495516.1 LysR family transcriptional regulator [Pararoseomonas indoligenes]